jgi:S-adenosylmethionine synthetase
MTGKDDVYVWMVSRIGTPINEPIIVSVQMPQNDMEDEVEALVKNSIDNMDKFCLELIAGKKRSI